MLEPRGDLDLALEPFDVDAGRHLRRKQLDDDPSAKSDFVGHEDPTHSGATELFFDTVGAAQCCLEAVSEVRMRARGHGYLVEIGPSLRVFAAGCSADH